MRSRQLETALTEFLSAAAVYLRGEVAAGAEVPFELDSRAARRGQAATPLYCYRALTGSFISEREAALKRLPGHAEAAKLLERYEGLDRYLASIGGDAAQAKGRSRVRAAVKALLEDAFDEQTDFELRPERLHAALERLQQAATMNAGEVTIVATLHGLTIGSAELALTKGLKIAQRDALQGVPEAAGALLDGDVVDNHLIVVHTASQDDDSYDALLNGRDVLKDLLSALRLFGDGRVTLGALAWARVGAGAWSALALGSGGRPRGMLVVTSEQEDELRAFCNLVSRRAPHDNELAWALRRFELGCERESSYEALSDNLLALRALLEPEGPSSGLLAGRLAALCATPEQRSELTGRIVQATALESSVIAGNATMNASTLALTEDVANHLRALLRDVICGHLEPELAAIADELLEEQQAPSSEGPEPEDGALASEEASSARETPTSAEASALEQEVSVAPDEQTHPSEELPLYAGEAEGGPPAYQPRAIQQLLPIQIISGEPVI